MCTRTGVADAARLSVPDIHPDAFVAANATIRGAVAIGARAVVMFGVVIRAEADVISVGEDTNLQDNVVVHCDEGIPTRIGRSVTVGHAAVVHGATVGDHCLVGIGSLVLNGAEWGEGAWLAAGSLLPEGKSIPPWTLAVGTPARPLRELTDSERSRQADGVVEYQRLRGLYKDAAAHD